MVVVCNQFDFLQACRKSMPKERPEVWTSIRPEYHPLCRMLRRPVSCGLGTPRQFPIFISQFVHTIYCIVLHTLLFFPSLYAKNISNNKQHPSSPLPPHLGVRFRLLLLTKTFAFLFLPFARLCLSDLVTSQVVWLHGFSLLFIFVWNLLFLNVVFYVTWKIIDIYV